MRWSVGVVVLACGCVGEPAQPGAAPAVTAALGGPTDDGGTAPPPPPFRSGAAGPG